MPPDRLATSAREDRLASPPPRRAVLPTFSESDARSDVKPDGVVRWVLRLPRLGKRVGLRKRVKELDSWDKRNLWGRPEVLMGAQDSFSDEGRFHRAKRNGSLGRYRGNSVFFRPGNFRNCRSRTQCSNSRAGFRLRFRSASRAHERIRL